jgi:hypothetical protein
MKMAANVRNLNVLDYGGGTGHVGVYLAMQGVDVDDFDPSPAGAEGAARPLARSISYPPRVVKVLGGNDRSSRPVITTASLTPNSSARLHPGHRTYTAATTAKSPMENRRY